MDVSVLVAQYARTVFVADRAGFSTHCVLLDESGALPSAEVGTAMRAPRGPCVE